MAWSRKKVDSQLLNNNNEYTKDSQLSIEALNGVVNSGLYSQDFVEHLADTPDVSEAGNVGTPTVTLVDNPNATTDKPYKRFKFANLKGAKGDKGDKGDRGDSGEIYQSTGTSTTGAMSQNATTEELKNKLSLSGGTMAGDIKLPSGKFIVDEAGYGLVGYYGTASATFGNPNRGINLRGNTIRPQYNSLDIAMCPVLLWENSAGSDANITFNKTISVGDVLEIWYSFNSNQPMAIRCKYTKDNTCIPISQSFISLQGTTYYLRVHNSDLYITSTGISQKYGYYAFLKLGGDGSNVSQNGAVNGEKAMIFAVYKV